MLFETTFTVVEVFENGAKVTHFLRGKKRDVLADIEMYKNRSKDYVMAGKKTMVVWA